MKLLWVLILFSLSVELPAQENIDSLIALWNRLSEHYIKVNNTDSTCKYGNCAVEMMDRKINREKDILDPDTLISLKIKKARALGTLVTAYGNSDRIGLALECYLSALKIFRETGQADDIFHLNIRMGRIFDLRSSYKDANLYYNKAREQALINNDKKGEALCYYYIGLNNRYLGNYSEALKYHLKDLRIEEEIGNKTGIANAYVTIAAILNTLNDREAAMEKLAYAKQLYEEIHDTAGIATVYNDLGNTYLTLGDTAIALQNHIKAASLREKIREYDGLGASNSYISTIYLHKGDYYNAEKYLGKADRAFQASSNRHGIMTTQIEMSKFYLKQKDADKALKWLEFAEYTANEIMNYQGLIDIYSIRGEIALLQHHYQQGKACFQQALAIAHKQHNHQQLYKLNAGLSDAYRKTGEYGKALDYLKTSILYKDSVNLNANFNAAVQMDMEYNYKKEKLENKLLQDQKDVLATAKLDTQKTQKKLYFAGIIMFLMLSLGLWSRLRFIRKAGKELLERKEEAERQRLFAESESLRATRSEKIKEQFLANMSHEIRTPMNAISGITDILLRNDHPESQDTYLEAIRQSSENLLVIINQILDLSKLEAGKIEPEKIRFEPMKIVQNVRKIMQFKAEEKGLKLSVKTKGVIPEFVGGDPTHLSQVLVNLTGNAIKFTEKGSVSITVTTLLQDNEKTILQFSISDTGIGIAKEKIDSVFEVFTQGDTNTTRKYGGTGLGLSICKQLVELNEGKITVESEINKGTCFTVEIPFSKAIDEDQNKTVEPVQSVKDLNILLAEDNEFNVMVATDVLQNAFPGVKIEVAENGRVAIEKVRSGDFDLILMDIQMPEMDGYDATRIIRQMEGIKAGIPVIAMTANVMKAEIDRCFEAGMNGYIAKPFDRSELLNQINKVFISEYS